MTALEIASKTTQSCESLQRDTQGSSQKTRAAQCRGEIKPGEDTVAISRECPATRLFTVQERPKHLDPSCGQAQPFGERLELGNSPACARLKARQAKNHNDKGKGRPSGRWSPNLPRLQKYFTGKVEVGRSYSPGTQENTIDALCSLWYDAHLSPRAKAADVHC